MANKRTEMQSPVRPTTPLIRDQQPRSSRLSLVSKLCCCLCCFKPVPKLRQYAEFQIDLPRQLSSTYETTPAYRIQEDNQNRFSSLISGFSFDRDTQDVVKRLIFFLTRHLPDGEDQPCIYSDDSQPGSLGLVIDQYSGEFTLLRNEVSFKFSSDTNLGFTEITVRRDFDFRHKNVIAHHSQAQPYGTYLGFNSFKESVFPHSSANNFFDFLYPFSFSYSCEFKNNYRSIHMKVKTDPDIRGSEVYFFKSQGTH